MDSETTQQLLVGDDYLREAMLLGDDDDDFEGAQKAPLKDVPPEVVQSHLLLGQRDKQTLLELTATNLFKEISVLSHFAGVQGMVLQINLKWLSDEKMSRKQEQDKTRQMINQIK